MEETKSWRAGHKNSHQAPARTTQSGFSQRQNSILESIACFSKPNHNNHEKGLWHKDMAHATWGSWLDCLAASKVPRSTPLSLVQSSIGFLEPSLERAAAVTLPGLAGEWKLEDSAPGCVLKGSMSWEDTSAPGGGFGGLEVQDTY